MPDQSLSPRTILNHARPLSMEWEGLAVEEIDNAFFYWLAVGNGGMGRLEEHCRDAYGVEPPEAGRFAVGKSGSVAVLLAWLAPGQYCLRGKGTLDAAPLEEAVHVTDQSDGWVGLSLTGARSRDVLARLCPLDLDESVFPAGSSARSPFEGMHCHLVCRVAASGGFELFFQRSSARSFVDHLRQAAVSVCGPALTKED